MFNFQFDFKSGNAFELAGDFLKFICSIRGQQAVGSAPPLEPSDQAMRGQQDEQPVSWDLLQLALRQMHVGQNAPTQVRALLGKEPLRSWAWLEAGDMDVVYTSPHPPLLKENVSKCSFNALGEMVAVCSCCLHSPCPCLEVTLDAFVLEGRLFELVSCFA